MPNVIILAGLQVIKDSENCTNKALVPINGKKMVEYVIDAMKSSERVGKIIIVGPGEELRKSLSEKVDAVIDSNGTIMQNLVAGIRYLGVEFPVLICSADVPMITPEAVNDFIEKSEALQADLCYPIVEKALNDKKFPSVQRTYVKTAEGAFTGGNLFYLNPAVVEKNYNLAEKLLGARKEPFKMARLLSFGFIIQLLLGTLTLKRIEKRFCDITGIKARVIISEYPEIGNDVDKSSDIAVATAYLSG